MPIERIGTFLETSDLGIAHSLGIESARLQHCIAEINRRKIPGVFGCPVFGFEERNLDFLAPLDGIKQVWLWEIDLQNIDGLYSQPGIEYLGILPKRPGMDFSRLPTLHQLVWQPVRNDRGLDGLQALERLDIWRHKTGGERAVPLRLPQSLKTLEFNWCDRETLAGLAPLPNLRELQIHYCRQFTSLDGLKTLAPNLKKLVVTRSAPLASWGEALEMDLEHVYINIRGKEVVARSIDRNRRTAP